jgi:hypothetical protein
MGKGGKVPPLSRRAPEVEGVTALAEPSPEGEQTGTEVKPEERGEQPASFQAPASLPQRVRGTGDRPRPPARVARPVLPASFLERVRAAAEAARREEEQASPDTPPQGISATRGSAFQAPPREAPATEAPAPRAPSPQAPAPESPASEAPVPEATPSAASTSLPRRVRGTSEGPRPPARVARPVLPPSLLERVRAAVQADADAEAEDQPHEPGPIPLPRRGPAESSPPQPHAGTAQRATGPGASSPGDANTEPIPVISVTAEPTAPSENAALAKPEAASAPPKRKTRKASARAKAAEVKAAEVKAAEVKAAEVKAAEVKAAEVKAAEVKAAEAKAAKAKAVARAQPRVAPSTHARTAPRAPRTAPGPGRPAQRQVRASRSYRMAGVLIAAVAVGALALGYAVLHHTGGNSAGQSSAGQSSAGGSSAGRGGSGGTRALTPAAIRRNAAAWVEAQVGSAAVISCDPVMCQALESRGLATGQLLVLKPGVISPLRSAVIVATPVLRKQIGSRLGSRYAPALLASFGSGGQQIQVRAIAPDGAAAYTSQAQADLALRKSSGSELAQSSRIVISAAARKELAAGEVDARLMTVITGLAASRPVNIVAFGDSGPDTATAPFRSAELAETNMHNMRAAVTAEEGSFRVAHMASVRLSTGRLVLRIDFDAPSPFGLLGSGG